MKIENEGNMIMGMITTDDRRLIARGLLTEREAANLPQWAKRKIARLQGELDEARQAVDRVKTAQPDSPFILSTGVNTEMPIGDRRSRLWVRRSGCTEMYDVSIQLNYQDGRIEVFGGAGPLKLELTSSNHFFIETRDDQKR